MRVDLGEKHEERVGLGVVGPTPVRDWGPLLTFLNPHFLMPLPKEVLRMQKGIMFVEAHREGQNTLVFVSSIKTGCASLIVFFPS